MTAFDRRSTLSTRRATADADAKVGSITWTASDLQCYFRFRSSSSFSPQLVSPFQPVADPDILRGEWNLEKFEQLEGLVKFCYIPHGYNNQIPKIQHSSVISNCLAKEGKYPR